MKTIGAKRLKQSVRLSEDSDSPIITYYLNEQKLKEYSEMIARWQDLAFDLDRIDEVEDEEERNTMAGIAAKLMVAAVKDIIGKTQYEEVITYLANGVEMTELDIVLALLDVYSYLMNEIYEFLGPYRREKLEKYRVIRDAKNNTH